MNWVPGQPVDWITPDVTQGSHTYCGNCGCDLPGCGCPRDLVQRLLLVRDTAPEHKLDVLAGTIQGQQLKRNQWKNLPEKRAGGRQQEIAHWDSILAGVEMARYLITRDGPSAQDEQHLRKVIREVLDEQVRDVAQRLNDLIAQPTWAVAQVTSLVAELAEAVGIKPHCGTCHGTGVVRKNSSCTCDSVSGSSGHATGCGIQPCPSGCPIPPVRARYGRGAAPRSS